MNDYNFSYFETDNLIKENRKQLKEKLIKDFRKLITRYELESNLVDDYSYMLLYRGIAQGFMLAKRIVETEGLTEEEFNQLEELISEQSKKMLDKLYGIKEIE